MLIYHIDSCEYLNICISIIIITTKGRFKCEINKKSSYLYCSAVLRKNN